MFTLFKICYLKTFGRSFIPITIACHCHGNIASWFPGVKRGEGREDDGAPCAGNQCRLYCQVHRELPRTLPGSRGMPYNYHVSSNKPSLSNNCSPMVA